MRWGFRTHPVKNSNDPSTLQLSAAHPLNGLLRVLELADQALGRKGEGMVDLHEPPAPAPAGAAPGARVRRRQRGRQQDEQEVAE